MNPQKKGSLRKKLGMLALAAVSAFGAVRAEEPKAEAGFDARAKVEYSGDVDNSHRVQTTLAAAPSGAYATGSVPQKVQVEELFRMYNIAEKKNGVWTDHSPIGLELSLPKLGELESKVLPFGSFGDIEALGGEAGFKLAGFSLALNAEYVAKNTINPVNDGASRLGAGLDYKIGQFTIGGGFDSVENKNGRANQELVHIMYDLDSKNSVGTAFILKQEADNSNTFSTGVYAIHYGKEEPWSARFMGRTDVNPEQDYTNLFGEIIVAQKSPMGKGAAMIQIGRGAGAVAIAEETFNQSVIPVSLSKVETVRVQDRSLEGVSIRARGAYTEKADLRTGCFSLGAGYMFGEVAGGQLGALLEYSYNIDSANGDFNALEPSVIWRPFNGRLELVAGAKVPTDLDRDAIVYGGVQYVF